MFVIENDKPLVKAEAIRPGYVFDLGGRRYVRLNNEVIGNELRCLSEDGFYVYIETSSNVIPVGKMKEFRFDS